jgi:hypothetical protein
MEERVIWMRKNEIIPTGVLSRIENLDVGQHKGSRVVNLTLLYTDSETVIPAKAEIQIKNHWIPGQARNDKYGKGISESLC